MSFVSLRIRGASYLHQVMMIVDTSHPSLEFVGQSLLPYATLICFKNSSGSFRPGNVASHALITLIRSHSL